jgi:hypothetical protein
MAVRIQFRRGTAAQWTSYNPVLFIGEFGYETDTRLFKVGDGVTNWNGLSYSASTITSITAGTGLTGGGTTGDLTIGIDTSKVMQLTTIDAKGDLLVGTADNTVARRSVGTNNQRLVADSAETTGVKWVSDSVNTVVDAKGDLLAGTADNTVARLGVGLDNNRLVADSSEATGLKWVDDSRNTVIDAKGDILIGTGDNVVARLGVGANKSIIVADSVQATGIKWSSTIENLTLSNCTIDGTNKVGTINVPITGTEKTTSYTLTLDDVGKYVQIGTGGSVTIPNSVFSQGDVISLVNNTSGNRTITCSTSSAYITGINTSKTSVSILTRGIATILFLSSTSCLISGNVF